MWNYLVSTNTDQYQILHYHGLFRDQLTPPTRSTSPWCFLFAFCISCILWKISYILSFLRIGSIKSALVALIISFHEYPYTTAPCLNADGVKVCPLSYVSCKRRWCLYSQAKRFFLIEKLLVYWLIILFPHIWRRYSVLLIPFQYSMTARAEQDVPKYKWIPTSSHHRSYQRDPSDFFKSASGRNNKSWAEIWINTIPSGCIRIAKVLLRVVVGAYVATGTILTRDPYKCYDLK